jgi:hypothetical protein
VERLNPGLRFKVPVPSHENFFARHTNLLRQLARSLPRMVATEFGVAASFESPRFIWQFLRSFFFGFSPHRETLNFRRNTMNRLMVRVDRAGAGQQVSRWKKRMDQSIRRAVKASRRAIHMSSNGSSYKAMRMALKMKKEVLKAAAAL